MKREDLIAPERYNLTSEIEKHAISNPNKIALKWESEQGETREITYGNLGGLKKGIKCLSWCLA